MAVPPYCRSGSLYAKKNSQRISFSRRSHNLGMLPSDNRFKQSQCTKFVGGEQAYGFELVPTGSTVSRHGGIS
jgi:hypothetical protein